MYQALYRKYRPQTFDDVYGQTNIVNTLKNAIINNKLSHAYLFCGPRGTGKTSVAKIIARTINCENLVDATPCNKCVNCTQNTTDIIEIDAGPLCLRPDPSPVRAQSPHGRFPLLSAAQSDYKSPRP